MALRDCKYVTPVQEISHLTCLIFTVFGLGCSLKCGKKKEFEADQLNTDSAKTKNSPSHIPAHMDFNHLCRLKPQPAEDEKHYKEQKLFHPSVPERTAASEP